MWSDPERFFARAATTVAYGRGTANPVVELMASIIANFSPRYLFRPDINEVFLTTVRLLPVEVVFFPLGLAMLWRMQGWRIPRFRLFLYVALLIAVLPAAVTFPNPHPLRAASCAVLIPFFSAAGVATIQRWLEARRQLRMLFRVVLPATILGSFCFVAYMYLFSASARGLRMQNALVQTAVKLRPHLKTHERVFIADEGVVQPYLYYVAFTGMRPRDFQEAPKEIHSVGGWDAVRRVGKFHFRSDRELVAQSTEPSASDLFVTRAPLPGSRLIDSVHWNWDHYYIADFPNR